LPRWDCLPLNMPAFAGRTSIAPRFPWECLTNRTVSRFPAPATSHVAGGFPALRAPAHFASRLMGPIPPERLPRPMADTIRGTPQRVQMYRRAIPGSTASSPSLDAGTLGPEDAASSFLPSIGSRRSTARKVLSPSISPHRAESGGSSRSPSPPAGTERRGKSPCACSAKPSASCLSAITAASIVPGDSEHDGTPTPEIRNSRLAAGPPYGASPHSLHQQFRQLLP